MLGLAIMWLCRIGAILLFVTTTLTISILYSLVEMLFKKLSAWITDSEENPLPEHQIRIADDSTIEYAGGRNSHLN